MIFCLKQRKPILFTFLLDKKPSKDSIFLGVPFFIMIKKRKRFTLFRQTRTCSDIGLSTQTYVELSEFIDKRIFLSNIVFLFLSKRNALILEISDRFFKAKGNQFDMIKLFLFQFFISIVSNQLFFS